MPGGQHQSTVLTTYLLSEHNHQHMASETSTILVPSSFSVRVGTWHSPREVAVHERHVYFAAATCYPCGVCDKRVADLKHALSVSGCAYDLRVLASKAFFVLPVSVQAATWSGDRSAARPVYVTTNPPHSTLVDRRQTKSPVSFGLHSGSPSRLSLAQGGHCLCRLRMPPLPPCLHGWTLQTLRPCSAPCAAQHGTWPRVTPT